MASLVRACTIIFFNYGGNIANGSLGGSDDFHSFSVDGLALNVCDFFTVNGTPDWAIIADLHSGLAAGGLYKLSDSDGHANCQPGFR